MRQRFLLRDSVYEHLRDRIVDGTLPPGHRLRDADVAEELQVSRTPVREALRRLEDEGLVSAEASRWTRVTAIDLDEAGRIYPIVWTLEALAVQQIPELEDEDPLLDEIAAINERIREALAKGDALAASEADRAFHAKLVGAAANPELTRVLADLKLRLRRLEVAYFEGRVLATRSPEEHDLVIERLSAGDGEGAAQAIADNWQQSFERVAEQLGRSSKVPLTDPA
jgi:DNA-binding GntR family transcriptional regulator